MGLISWIKDQYYDYKFQSAKQALGNGEKGKAIAVLEGLLDKHPDAPAELSEIYHSEIKNGKRNRINDVAKLYSRCPGLNSLCNRFAQSLGGMSSSIPAAYCQALYEAGMQGMNGLFVKYATAYILNTKNVRSLDVLTNNQNLLSSLSSNLVEESKRLYDHKFLQEASRLCKLIAPHQGSKSFFDLYANVRLDELLESNISASSVRKLDELLSDITRVYALPASSTKGLTSKIIKSANGRFANKDFAGALQLSRRLIGKSQEARVIYKDSALQIYKSRRNDSSLIEAECLYKCLGSTNAELINALVPYLPYGIHKTRYIQIASVELKRLVTGNFTEAELLFNKVWQLVPDASLITSLLSSDNSGSNEHFADFILNHQSGIINDKIYCSAFVSRLQGFSSKEYVVKTLETLLDKGVKVNSEYADGIIRFAKSATSKRKRIEIIQRGLSRVHSDTLYAEETKYLQDYLSGGRYDHDFAKSSINALVGHSDLAEVLLCQLLLDDADKSSDDAAKEKALREALGIRSSHNRLFNSNAYDALLPKINAGIIQLAERIHSVSPSRAYGLLHLLRDNNLAWFDCYAKLCLDSLKNEVATEVVARKLYSVIKEGNRINSNAIPELWSAYIDVRLRLTKQQSRYEAIHSAECVLEEIKRDCAETCKDNCILKVLAVLCSLLLSKGRDLEQSRHYDEAIQTYRKILSTNGQNQEVECRIGICNLKKGGCLKKEDAKTIQTLLSTQFNSSSQKDLAYRWCLCLIGHGEIEQAEDINSRLLSDPELTQVCNEVRIRKQLETLEQLNITIGKLNQSQLSAEEAVSLGKSLSSQINGMNLVASFSRGKIETIKETIRTYAIKKFYEAGEYIKCFDGLKVQDNTYLSDPVALRNVAIMCLCIAENGMLTTSNYKEVISIWVTAVYQQRIFVESLDYTSWDDPYTFSLDSALGHTDLPRENLPFNVNYKSVAEAGVVSILEVQKNLLQRMETAIRDNADYLKFYNTQLEAIDLLCEQNLDTACVIVTPYMMSLSNTYRDSVCSSLTTEANHHYDNWEAILYLGTLYGITAGEFQKYSVAYNLVDIAKSAVDSTRNVRRRNMAAAFADNKIDQIRPFTGLMSKLTSYVSTAVNKEISQEADYSEFYKTYGFAVKTLRNEALSFAFSNYINQQIVKKLNDKSLTLANGSTVLFDVYGYCSCNPHLKRNIGNIVEALVHDYIADGNADNLTVLDNVLSTTRQFDGQVVKALKGDGSVPEDLIAVMFASNETRFNNLKKRIGQKSNAIRVQFASTSTKIESIKLNMQLSEIVQKVNDDTIAKCDALVQVYEIYKVHKNDSRVCTNLATLVPMCIMEYIVQGKTGKAKVKTVLNALKVNMSPAFKANSSEIAQAYRQIWNSLPLDAKHALSGSSGLELNENGRRLKEGLDYLNALKR